MLAANRDMMGLFRRKKDDKKKFDYSDGTKEAFAERDAFYSRLRQEMGGSAENPELQKDHAKGDRVADADALLESGFDPYAQGVAKPYQCEGCGTRFQERWGRCTKCGGNVSRSEDVAEVTELQQRHDEGDKDAFRQVAPDEHVEQQLVPEMARAREAGAIRTEAPQQGDFVCSACGKGYREKWSRSPCCGQMMQPRDNPDAAPAPQETFEPSSGAGIDPLAGLLGDEPNDIAPPVEELEIDGADEEEDVGVRMVGGDDMTDFGARKGSAVGPQKRIPAKEAQPKKRGVKRVVKRKKKRK